MERYIDGRGGCTLSSINRLSFVLLAVSVAMPASCVFDPVASLPSGRCGNGSIDPGEDCDGINLSGEDCLSVGFSGGTLACKADCRFDTSGCTETCGNGVIDRGELCDGTQLGSATCEMLGFDGGTLACTEQCRFDTTGCGQSLCGNGTVDATEDCDGSDLAGQSCESLGLGNGVLDCTVDCRFDPRGCAGGTCGDGIAQPVLGEECDGSDLGGHGCRDIGLTGGPPLCSDDCRLDYSSCTKRPLGSPCSRSEQCDSGLCLLEATAHVPRGLCIAGCSEGDPTCPNGSHCTELARDQWYCLEDCTSGSCSRPGYSCFGPKPPRLTGAVCYPFCRSDSQCESGECNAWLGLCGVPEAGTGVGGPCSANDDCKGGLCLTSLPGGYCTAPCDLLTGCPTGTVCVDWLDSGATDFGICLDSCSESSECREPEGYWCGDSHGTSGVCIADQNQ